MTWWCARILNAESVTSSIFKSRNRARKRNRSENLTLGDDSMALQKESPRSDPGPESVFAPEIALVDLNNSKGHGFKCYQYEGIYWSLWPHQISKGKSPVEEFKRLKECTMEEDDIIICAYAKCGTHWLWEVSEMLKSGTIQYKKETKETRMIEFIQKEGIDSLQKPRILNTHLPLRMLPTQVVEKKVKCIQIMRNPKDVCVSFYNHKKNILPSIGYDGDFVEFTEAFLSGKLPFGSYHNYLLTWQKEVAREPNLPVLTLHYEVMKVNPVRCIKDIATFLNITVTDTFCEGIAEACSFDKMKQFDKEEKHMHLSLWKEGSGGSFYRKGEVGDWKNWFTVAENEKFDRIWNDKVKESGIQFMYTL
ncbi:sulfotransferase 1B1-like isoform X3 [Haliotis rufescens]|uniref:sulfotransferase 1B1-like isoform X3 n=1 Tax=Haliotis rufescens TaxID=6454 RepID=UPI00201ED137|nr:sulfotransferase 1B1-like isoform X3 [Haliotis rufescens]